MLTRREFLYAAAGSTFSMSLADAPSDTLTSRRLAGMLEPIRTKTDLPALAAVAIEGGRVVAEAATGVRKYGGSTRVTARDRFHLGSCTKAMTATLVAMLIEEGKLDWTTPLSEGLPEIAEDMHPDMRRVTVDHLLAHRSGLAGSLHPAPANLAEVAEGRRSPEASRRQRLAFVTKILRGRPATEPGATYAYSNAGYMVLGAIVERLLDAPWEEIMRKRIFGLLRMRTGGFGAMGTPGKTDQPWQHRLRDGQHVPISPGILADNPPALGPAGTAHCSPGDWGKYLAATLMGQRERGHLLRPETWQRLLSPQFGGNYAGGWLVTQRAWGGTVLTHAGSNTMSFCVAWLAPEKGFGVGVMTNQGGDEAARACDEVAGAVIQSLAKGDKLP